MWRYNPRVRGGQKAEKIRTVADAVKLLDEEK